MTNVASDGSEATALKDRHFCIVTSALGAGGAERVIAWLATDWLEHGATVTIVSFDGPGDPIYHDFPAQARLVRLGIQAPRGPRRIVPLPLRRVIALRKTLAALAPDAAIGFLTKINVLVLAATVGSRIPLIVCERNNPLRQPAHPLWKLALRGLYGRATAIVCQTQASIACIPERVRDRVTVIPNPVSPVGSARPGIRTPLRVAAVGRLEPQKGFDLLIDAFADVAGRHPDWSLDLWGSGHREEALRLQVSQLGLADRVRLRGVSARPSSWIEEVDLFVLSSRYEGFPNVLGEAMAAGLPVIATDCDYGSADLVDHDANGLLIPNEDPAALATALDRMMGDHELRERLASKAPDVAMRFAPERIAGIWRNLLRRVINPASADESAVGRPVLSMGEAGL